MLLLLMTGNLYAQIQCDSLGQNPETAFPVCGSNVFHQGTVPFCGGEVIISPCDDPTGIITNKNPYWYKFTCFSSGKLAFFITPDSTDEDYDWMIYDITGHSPRDVYTDTSLVIACNWSGEKGLTGASEFFGGTSVIECSGYGINLFSAMPNLVQGHNYLLLISHFEATPNGYNLSFGGVGNTAVITDTLTPHMVIANPTTCSAEQVLIKLNKRMKCGSVASNGSDFKLTPANAAITGAATFGCSRSFDTDSVLVSFNQPLPPGNYSISIQNGTDNNTILDICDNGIAAGEDVSLTVLSPSPVPLDSLGYDHCKADSFDIYLPSPIKCSSVAPDGSDFTFTGNYPVNILSAQPQNCQNGLSNMIRIYPASPLLQPGNFQLVLQKGSDGNTLLSECDTPSVAGSSLAFNIKPKPVAAFTKSSSVCLPDAVIHFTNQTTISDSSENLMRYMWDFDDPASGINNTSIIKNPQHTYQSPGPFLVKLQVTSNAGCVKDSTILLNTIRQRPTTHFGFDKPAICLGDDVVMKDSSNAGDGIINRWFWNLGDGSGDNTGTVTHTYLLPQSYNVSLSTINSYGCIGDTLTKKITVYKKPTVDAGPDRLMLQGTNITLQTNATGDNLQYNWVPASFLSSTIIANPKCIHPDQDITYKLTITSDGGCQASDDVLVKLLKQPLIPNTFTPNNDGINDLWIIKYLDDYPYNRVQIFTRAGQKVYENTGYYKPWNGTLNGKTLPFDTYYYIIEPGNGRDAITGYVTILK